MKKELTIVLLLAASLFAAQAQPVVLNTNTSPPTLAGPGVDAFNTITTATNWIVAPFFEYSPDAKEQQWGGGMAAIVNLNESRTLATMLRADYVEGDWWMPSASLQLQFPITVASNITITPFAFTGVALPLGGKDKTTLQGVFGSGFDIKMNKLSKHWSMAFDVEYWSVANGIQYRFSPFVWKF